VSSPRSPEPPIAFSRPPAKVDTRLSAPPGAEMDERTLARLRAVCARVDTDDRSCIEAGRDWWPLAIRWATGGQSAGRAGAVARPADAAQVASVLAVCNDAGLPVTAAAGRSGVCGSSVPVFGGVVLDLCGLASIGDVDDDSLLVEVAPGTFGDDLEEDLRSNHGLTLGHWPQSVAISTVGGWLSCRSAGQYSTRYGKVEDMAAGLEVALADGRTIRTGWAGPRSATGPDLTQIFVGAEGTLGVITSALLRARPLPPAEERRAFGFGSFAEGLDACRRILRRGATPAVLRLYDETESKRHFDTEATCVLVVLDEAEPALVEATISLVAEECAAARRLDPALVEKWLSTRNDTSALAPLVSAGIVVDTVEVAARWSVLADLYVSAVAALRSIDGTLAASAHQSHSYPDGACLYFTFAGRGADPTDDEWAESYYRSAWDAVMGATTAAGGSISHHHGVGINRARYLPGALGPSFDVLASLKAALDPEGILNPGKLALPSRFGEAPWP
jgi:alkyldihydroxyacetonephosphate synthase